MDEHVGYQLQEMSLLLDHLALDQSPDTWCTAGAKEVFSAVSFYNSMNEHVEIHVAFHWKWDSSFQLKHKIFCWLLRIDRLNTRAMLLRKNFHLPSYSCILCQQGALETRDHLFFYCPFALACWRYLCPRFMPHGCTLHILSEIKRQLNKPFGMDMITLACWSIWRVRNDFIFNNVQPSLYRCRRIFLEKINLVFHRAKRKYHSAFLDWPRTFR